MSIRITKVVAMEALRLGLSGMALVLCGCGPKSGGSPSTPAGAREVVYGFPADALVNSSIVASVDTSDGNLSLISGSAVPFLSAAGTAIVNSQFVYVSAGDALFGYSIGELGELTPLVGSPFTVPAGAALQGLTAVPNKMLLFAAATNGIEAIQVDPATGILSFIPGSPFPSGRSTQITVDPSGDYLYASDDDDPGGISGFAIGPSGALTAMSGSPFPLPGLSGLKALPVSLVDTGQFLYVALQGTDQVAGFAVNATTGALISVAGSPFPTGKQPASLVHIGNFLYVMDEGSPAISGFSITLSTGALVSLVGSPFPSDGGAMIADPTGRYLYDSTSVGIFHYDVNPDTGALTKGSAALSNDGTLLLNAVQLSASP